MHTLATAFNREVIEKVEQPVYEWPLPKQLMGIEIELERAGQHSVLFPMETSVSEYWRATRDGSLVDGREYVLIVPLAGQDLSDAISMFFASAVTERASTSSTHIHLNMLDNTTTPQTLQNLVMLVYILEKAIFTIADPGREWCGFTNSITTASEDLLNKMLSPTLVNDAALLKEISEGNLLITRYLGLNVLALAKYGSVEFRYFPTATSAEELYSWVELVQQFKKAAIELENLDTISQVVSDEASYVQFISTYFYKWKEQFLASVPATSARKAFYKALTVASYSQAALPVEIDRESILSSKKFAKLSKTKAVTEVRAQVETIHEPSLPAYQEQYEQFGRPICQHLTFIPTGEAENLAEACPLYTIGVRTTGAIFVLGVNSFGDTCWKSIRDFSQQTPASWDLSITAQQLTHFINSCTDIAPMQQEHHHRRAAVFISELRNMQAGVGHAGGVF